MKRKDANRLEKLKNRMADGPLTPAEQMEVERLGEQMLFEEGSKNAMLIERQAADLKRIRQALAATLRGGEETLAVIEKTTTDDPPERIAKLRDRLVTALERIRTAAANILPDSVP